MKILEWMHHKFRHNNIKPFKDVNIGSSCICLSAQASLDDQDPYSKPNFGPLEGFTSLKLPKQDKENYFFQFEANKDDEASTAISEVFHGFLTIGTLGSDASINEPATPTFATPLENITGGIIKVTENDLKLINYELEKFLEAESKEDWSEESSARNSNVSIITLGGKQMERAEDEDYWKTAVCPLQGYLFGSSIELAEARKEPKQENAPEARTELKKEEKTQFRELFHKTEAEVGNCTEKCSTKQFQDKHKHKSAMCFMKKIIKKVRPSPKSSPHAASDIQQDYVTAKKELGRASDSVSTKKKLHKVLRLFHRKIHPETSMAEREFDLAKKCETKNTPRGADLTNGRLIHQGGENRIAPQGSISMDRIPYNANKMNSLQQSNLGNLKGHGEHWIKIDEDYLVLEL